MTMVQKAKTWLKAEESQLSNENGMFIILLILLVIGIGALLAPYLQSGFDKMMQKFDTSAGTSTSTVDNPLGDANGWY